MSQIGEATLCLRQQKHTETNLAQSWALHSCAALNKGGCPEPAPETALIGRLIAASRSASRHMRARINPIGVRRLSREAWTVKGAN